MPKTDILLHTIDWWANAAESTTSPQELDESSIEHIERCIKDGINNGELCIWVYDSETDTDTEYRGWWRIII